MAVMGVDIGTSGCKAAVFDDRGRQLSRAYREYSLIHEQPGWAELDPDEVMDKCVEVIREAARAAPEPVEALAISSQGEAFTAVDARGRPLCRAMVSSDARAADLARDWSEVFGREKLYRITGHTAHPLFTLFKLLWLRERRPEIWRAAARFHCFEDLLHARLGLDPAIGWSLAGRTMLFDVNRHEWSREILDAVGLAPERLARPLASGAIVGTLSGTMADQLGLAAGATVATGGHDQPCNALGGGGVRDGVAVYGLGTVECITPVFGQPVMSRELFEANLATYDHAIQGMYATVAYSLTGGNLLRWFRDQFGMEEAREADRLGVSPYELLLGAMPAEPTNLLVLPYFTPSGTPYFDASTAGAVLGLRLTTTRWELLRALLEGVTYEMRLNLEILGRSGVAIDELRVTGGGAVNRAWMQLKADIMNRSIVRPRVTEAGCLGVAMLARAARDGGNVRELADAWVERDEAFQPDPTNAARYDERFEDYRRLYRAVRDFEAEGRRSRPTTGR